MPSQFRTALPATPDWVGSIRPSAHAGRPADPIAERFQRLKARAEALPYDHDSKAVSGFSDVKLTANFLRDRNGQAFNGHRIDSNTIACAAPTELKPESMSRFAATMVEQHVGLIVDLRALGEMLGANYRPAEQKSYPLPGQSASFQAHSVQKGIAGYSDTAAQSGMLAVTAGGNRREIGFMNFPIRDFGARSAEDIDKIASALNTFKAANPERSVAVHCRAGVGRTGMVLIAAELRQAHAKGELNDNNREQVLDQAIHRLRGQRSNMMVQSVEQFRALDGYSKDLVARRFDYDIARDQPKRAQPGRAALAAPLPSIAQAGQKPPVPPRKFAPRPAPAPAPAPPPVPPRAAWRGAPHSAAGTAPPIPAKPAGLAAQVAAERLSDINLELTRLQATRAQLQKARGAARAADQGARVPAFLSRLVRGGAARDAQPAAVARFLDEKQKAVDAAIDAKIAEGDALIAQRRNGVRTKLP